MKLNKKIIGLGLVAVAALGLAACARGGRGGSSADSKVKAAIVTAEGELGVEGRVLVRASGTEPLIRVMAEGPNQEELQALCQEIADIIGREQGLAEK